MEMVTVAEYLQDLEWCREVDPATVGFLQPLLYFKGTQAVLLQRITHQLWISGDLGKKMVALALQGRGSEVLGVDAHPGAFISYAVMLDHATGVVIGEVPPFPNTASNPPSRPSSLPFLLVEPVDKSRVWTFGS